MNLLPLLLALMVHVPEIFTDVEAGISRISTDTTVQNKVKDTAKMVSAVANAAVAPPPTPQTAAPGHGVPPATK